MKKKKEKYATTWLFSKKREERGSRDNLRDINRDYEERGKQWTGGPIQTVQISFNTCFYFGIAFVSASDQLKWCCGICQTKCRTWWSKMYFRFLLIPNWKCLLWFVRIWIASLDQKQLKESLWISNASWKLIMEDYHSPQHRLDLPLEMKYHLDRVFWE